ncbi:MAG: hypothetical protein FP815_13310, partial [Desulfobulbaceae bacterium]|nr:hypothetical protein [Desulfobulbaceae bacterium]
MNKKKFIDILFWADINPLKRGSFEDFICGLATECNKRNININFLFGSKISKAVEKVFHDNQVSYILLPDHDISSVFALAKILKKNKPKMIHFHFIGPGSPLVPIALLLGVKRIIMTDHTSRLVNNVTT